MFRPNDNLYEFIFLNIKQQNLHNHVSGIRLLNYVFYSKL